MTLRAPTNRRLGIGLLCLLAAACSGEQRTPWPHAGVLRFQGQGEPTREQGPWSYWYENGQLREQGSFDDGRRTGTWRQWFQNGQRKAMGERLWDADTRASERSGAWSFWHENGQLRSRGSFVRGRRQGSWEAWDDAGEVDDDETGLFRDDIRQP
ncbi:MAG: hypothetical protein ACI8QZ_003701 [Chlamydiales bacterium]